MSEIKMTTPGEWIVSTTNNGDIVVIVSDTQKIIATFGHIDDANANEHIANAALFAVSKNMLDALIAIQTQALDPGTDEVDLIAINELNNSILAKLVNEAGEEL